MTVTDRQPENNQTGEEPESAETVHPSQQAQQMAEFGRQARRYAKLDRAFSATDQRERTTLQVSLMELYAQLNPKSIYRWDDDFDVVMRHARQGALRS